MPDWFWLVSLGLYAAVAIGGRLHVVPFWTPKAVAITAAAVGLVEHFS